MTKDAAGLGATMGAAVGVVTYFGDGSNLAGLGLTFFPISYDPGISSTNIPTTTNITLDWNHPIKAGSGTITIRSGSASGTILDQFVVGSSSSITFANNQVILDPAVDLSNDTQYFVTYPAGSIKSLGDKYQNDQLIYSFTAKPAPITSIWLMGDNGKGALGQNETTQRSSPVQIPGAAAATSWTSMGVCSQSIYGTKADGTLWSWGYNYLGNLGQNQGYPGGSAKNYSSPTQIGTGTDWAKNLSDDNGMSAAALKTDGSLWSWGYNGRGNLGHNQGPNMSLSSPTQIPGNWSTAIITRTSGGIKTDGTFWTWGNGSYGQLGQNTINTPNNAGTSSPVQLPGTNWSKVSTSQMTLGAIKTDGTLWMAGINGYGELGQNSAAPNAYTGFSSPVQIPGTTWRSVTMDSNFTIGTKTDGTLWSWGRSYMGYTAQNTSSPNVNYSSPTQIGTDTTWVGAKTNQQMTIASKTDGSLWAWGRNSRGQFAQNNKTNYSSPVQIPGSWLASDGAAVNPVDMEAGSGYTVAGALKSGD